MNLYPLNILPVSQARGRLGDLTEEIKDEKYILLTKGGKAKAALVDPEYFVKLQQAVDKFYQKTFIDPKLLPFTREFSDAEINEWQKSDQL